MARLLTALLVLIPQAVSAQEPLGDVGSDFTYQKLVRIAERLVDYLLQLAELAAVGFIVYYGLRMVMSRGDPGQYAAAKKGLGLAILGAVVIFGVYTIIQTVRGGVQSIGN